MLDRINEMYYTAKQAREKLGLNEHTFQSWVKTGKLSKFNAPNIGHGLYLRREVDAKAALIEAALFLDPIAVSDFHAARPPEVDAEIHLSHLLWGKRALRPEFQRARRLLVETNPESTWYLYDREMLAASINIVPVDDWAIEQFKQGMRGWLFVPDHVKQFEPGGPLDAIVIDFMTTPAVPPERQHAYALHLLKEIANTVMRRWGDRGVELRNLYTCGGTEIGRNLLRNRWFTELGEPVPGRVIFELPDVLHSGFSVLQPYQDAFNARRNADASPEQEHDSDANYE